MVSSTANPVRVAFSATMFYPFRNLEVWVDGVKSSETYHVFGTQGYSDLSLTLAIGKRKIDLFAVAYDGTTLKHLTYYTTVK